MTSHPSVLCPIDFSDASRPRFGMPRLSLTTWSLNSQW
jgi:hypothetical protein